MLALFVAGGVKADFVLWHNSQFANIRPMKEIAYSKQARKTLMRIPSNEAAKIRQKMQQYATDPASLANNVKRLQGMPYYRLRVGDWRVIFDESGTVIAVVAIGPRGGIYD
jgi:mRNA interferase RelE/StbE